jgi:Tfp pilus assembly protein PilF
MRGKKLMAVLALATGAALARGGDPPAGRLSDAALAALGAGAGAARVPLPPYKRQLQGDDAKRAAALEKQIDELWAAGKFAEAVEPAQEVAALRRRAQGEKHWEAADAGRKVETLRKALDLTADQRAALAAAPGLTAKAEHLHGRSKYAEAEPLLRKALAACEAALGPAHPATARGYNDLAANLHYQGRRKEAEPLFRQALAAWEAALGPAHPHTAESYSNLASNLHAQGRDKEAEPLDRKAVDAYERALGPGHPDTARGYNNLGMNLHGQGRFREAEPLLRKVLATWEAELGPAHPHTALGYHNLASCLDAQGRYREAEPLDRKAVAAYERARGPGHPDTARGYNCLALNLYGQGRYKEAEPLFRRALATWEAALGPGHPDTAESYNNLALNLDAQGRYREAEPLFRRALAAWEGALGPAHPQTATGYHNLALNLGLQGRHAEAEPLFRRALATYEAALGPAHPDTIGGFNSLAVCLNARGRYAEAEPLFRRALAAWEEALGPGHPDTARGYHNLAMNLQAQGRHAEAEPLHRKAVAAKESALGPAHPDTAEGYNGLANCLSALGRAREAEPLQRKALAACEAALGPAHPHTARVYNLLGHNLQAQGRYQNAEPLWQAAAEGLEASRLRLAASSLDRAAAARIRPHLGLAACRARLGRGADAWEAAEAGLARGLLDDLAARAALPPDPERERGAAERAARLAELDRLLPPLVAAEKLPGEDRRRRGELLAERAAREAEAAREAAGLSRRAVLPLDTVQARLAPDEAFAFWVDLSADPGAADPKGDHWGCVVRRAGAPAWVRLPGSGEKGAWTEADDKLPGRLRDSLSRGESDASDLARRLAAQRLGPLAQHLAARNGLPAARRLVVAPVGRMAGVPVEALTEDYLVSYAPSGTVLARLRQEHRPLEAPTLLALGDPDFALPTAAPLPAPPDHGLYLALVLPDGNAARAGLRAGDVLLRYGGAQLRSKADLKTAEGGDRVPAAYWRDGKVEEAQLAPGKLGVVLSDDPPAAALRKARERALLADARTRDDATSLPGTRLEARAIAALLPPGKAELLLGSDASEQRLGELAASGKLTGYRLVHLATHGTIDRSQAGWSYLLLARDTLPGPAEQTKLAAAGKQIPTGRLTVETIARQWQLDADLVCLSACETALGPDAGGEGLLGFSQVLVAKGARSLVLSLWKVNDTATALLMTRFYQNLLGKREGLKAPLPKAEALREAKQWLRTLPIAERDALAAKLGKGELRGTEVEARPVAKAEAKGGGDAPYAHPRYWAAFILIGDLD